MKDHFRKRKYAVAVAKRIEGKNFTELQYAVLNNGFNYWVADPFPIEYNGTLYIFGEVFEYTKNKGSIGYTKLINGVFTPWKKVIEETYHLSFPNIIFKDNNIFICPEANESNSIYLYRCIDFPDIWTKDKTILNEGKYVDTVFYKQDSRIYAITYDVKEGNDLRIVSIDNQCMVSEERVKNAVSEYSRPAGKIYYDKSLEKEILPTQIGEPTYGAGIVLNDFSIDWPQMAINPLNYLYPKDFTFDKKREYIGIHTLNFTENYVVVDVKWYGFNAINFLFKIGRKLFGTPLNNR